LIYFSFYDIVSVQR